MSKAEWKPGARVIVVRSCPENVGKIGELVYSFTCDYLYYGKPHSGPSWVVRSLGTKFKGWQNITREVMLVDEAAFPQPSLRLIPPIEDSDETTETRATPAGVLDPAV